MYRNIGLFFAFLFILLLGFWIQYIRHQNEILQAKLQKSQARGEKEDAEYHKLYDDYMKLISQLHSSQSSSTNSLASLTAQLASERQRLADMKKNLASMSPLPTVNSASNDDAADHLDEDQTELKHLEYRLNHLNEENQKVTSDSNAYLYDQQNQIDQQKIDLGRQIQGLDDRMAQDRLQLNGIIKNRNNPGWQNQVAPLNADIATSNSQKGQLTIQKNQLDLARRQISQQVSSEVQKERADIVGERAAMNKQIADLKSDIEEWKKKKTDTKKAKPDDTRIADLRREISSQAEKVANLEKMVRVLQEKTGQ